MYKFRKNKKIEGAIFFTHIVQCFCQEGEIDQSYLSVFE